MKPFLLALLSIAPFWGFAQNQNVFYYHPNSVFQLGADFSKDDYSQLFARQALSYKLDTVSKAPTSFSVNSYVFYDANSLVSKLHLDSKVEARALVFKGTTEFNLDVNSAFESNSITIGFIANQEYGEIRLKDPELKPEAQSLINAANYKAFRTQFGTHFVSQVSRGIYVYVLMTIENTTRSYQNKYGIKLAGSMDLGAVSASFGLDLNKEISDAATNGRIKLQVFGIGGGGLPGLKDVVGETLKQHPNMDAISNAIKNFVGAFNSNDAVPVAFNTSSFDQFGLIYDDIWDNDREELTESVAMEYKKLDQYGRIVDNLLDRNLNKFYLLDSVQRNLLDSIQPVIKARKQVLVDSHLKLLKGDSISTIQIGSPIDFDFARIIPSFPTFKIFCDCRIPGTNGKPDQLMIHGTGIPLFLYPDKPNSNPAHFAIISDLNIPENLRIIKNVQLFADDSLLVDYSRDVANDGTGFHLECNDIRDALYSYDMSYAVPLRATSFDELIGRFESSKRMAFLATNNQEKKILYTIKISDIFGNVETIAYSRLVLTRMGLAGDTYYEIIAPSRKDAMAQSAKISFDNGILALSDSLYLYIEPIVTANTPIVGLYSDVFNKKMGLKILPSMEQTTFGVDRISFLKQVIVYWGLKDKDLVVDSNNKLVHAPYKMVIDIPQKPFQPELHIVFKTN